MDYVDIVVFDTETNGLNPETDDLLSIGWVKIRKYIDSDGFEYIERCEYFNNDENIHNNDTTKTINGIDDEFRITYGKDINEILNIFENSVCGSYVFAFNVQFDVNFVRKYDPDVFSRAIDLCEIQVNKWESVLNSLQRIVYEYFNSFNHWVYISNHLHSAFDDVTCEMFIMLHDVMKCDIRQCFVALDEPIEPVFTSGKYKGSKVVDVMRNDAQYIEWFMNVKKSPHEDYLRHYIESLAADV